MDKIRWGIIGCGDVTEVKSGPAFNKVSNSELVAVMRRDEAKAADYARRHQVPKYYTDAEHLINDPDINAVYVATPPAFHEDYTIKALRAGKNVYVEKPMATNAQSCINMLEAANQTGSKLSVAHYRREMPLFKKIEDLLKSGLVGKIRFVNLQMLKETESKTISQTEENWRVNPAISGGGLFHDLAPHQIDMMLNYFGVVAKASGLSARQEANYPADNIVTAEILFQNNIVFKGLWCFNVPSSENIDICEIVGSEGKISFSFFGPDYSITLGDKVEHFSCPAPMHVEQPMIQKVVEYFRDECENPCSAEIGIEVLRLMDLFTKDSADKAKD